MVRTGIHILGPTIQTHHCQVYQTATAVDAAGTAAAPEYDSDDNLIVPDDKRGQIGPLKALDHAAIEYEEFTKDLYMPAPEIASMTEGQVCTLNSHLRLDSNPSSYAVHYANAP